MSFLLKVILFVFIAYHAIRLLARALFPFMFREMIKNMNKQSFNNQPTNRKKDGEVTIIDDQKNEKTKNKQKGEYTDYEEIK